MENGTIHLYHECFYTDEEWEHLIYDAENADTGDDLNAQLEEYERSQIAFDQYCHDQWLSFCAQRRPQ